MEIEVALHFAAFLAQQVRKKKARAKATAEPGQESSPGARKLGTSACRRINQLAAATKHPPMERSAATSSNDGLNPSGWSVGMTCQ